MNKIINWIKSKLNPSLNAQVNKMMVKFDLKDESQITMLKAFEREVGDRSFNQYCADKGLYRKEIKELADENKKPYTLTVYHFVPEKLKELALAKSKYEVLGEIKECPECGHRDGHSNSCVTVE